IFPLLRNRTLGPQPGTGFARFRLDHRLGHFRLATREMASDRRRQALRKSLRPLRRALVEWLMIGLFLCMAQLAVNATTRWQTYASAYRNLQRELIGFALLKTRSIHIPFSTSVV